MVIYPWLLVHVVVFYVMYDLWDCRREELSVHCFVTFAFQIRCLSCFGSVESLFLAKDRLHQSWLLGSICDSARILAMSLWERSCEDCEYHWKRTIWMSARAESIFYYQGGSTLYLIKRCQWLCWIVVTQEQRLKYHKGDEEGCTTVCYTLWSILNCISLNWTKASI